MLALLLALLAPQQVVVDPGPRDRAHVPVRVPLPADAPSKPAVLVDAEGRRLPAQVVTEGGARALVAVVPSLKAGTPATFTLAWEAAEAPAFRWHDAKGEHLELRQADRPVLRYMYAPLDDSSKEAREKTYKPFHHVFDPAGTRLLTKGPGGQYTHHRGLYYGFNKVTYGDGRKADVWHCGGDAHQLHEAVLAVEEGPVLGRHTVEIAWRGVGKEVFAREERTMGAWAVPGGTLVEFTSHLEAKKPPVKLDGDPQHAGFHFRADNEVSAKTKKETVYVRPDGPGRPGETRNWPGLKTHVNLPWNAMSFVLDGKRYTALYLDHPENPKEARFSERDYGRFGSYFEHMLDGAAPLVVRYRVWIQEGTLTPEEAAARSADFTNPPTGSIR